MAAGRQADRGERTTVSSLILPHTLLPDVLPLRFSHRVQKQAYSPTSNLRHKKVVFATIKKIKAKNKQVKMKAVKMKKKGLTGEKINR